MKELSRRLTAVGVAFLSVGALSTSALGFEPGVLTASPPGASVGVPAGALPPPGIYMNNQVAFVTGKITTPTGGDTGIRVHVPFYDFLVLWVPGWEILGASYGAYLLQPFSSIDGSIPSLGLLLNRNAGVHNTYLQPLLLSWNFKNGWFMSAGAGFYAPTGTVTNQQTPVVPGVLGTGGPGYEFWTFKPTWAISYLGDGWNLTANLALEMNTENRSTRYKSGNVFYADLTATKKFGKWEIGPVGYYMDQTTLDSVSAGNSYLLAPGNVPLSKDRRAGIGGLIGYDWGPVKLQVFAMHDVYSRNDCSCTSIYANLSFRLWAPEEAPPAGPKRPIYGK